MYTSFVCGRRNQDPTVEILLYIRPDLHTRAIQTHQSHHCAVDNPITQVQELTSAFAPFLNASAQENFIVHHVVHATQAVQ